MTGKITKHVGCIAAALMLMLPAAMTAGGADQYHRHTPRTETDGEAAVNKAEAVAAETAPQKEAPKKAVSTRNSGKAAAVAKKGSAKKKTDDAGKGADEATEEVTAYSDTTSQTGGYNPAEDSMTYSGFSYTYDDAFKETMSDMLATGGSMLGTLLILLIMFIVSPLAILGLILYFVYKNRKQKYRLAEMAIKAGLPIPDDMRIKPARGNEETIDKGIKNIFLGAGLVALFWCMDFSIGIGVGLLVVFNGAGQAVIAYTTERRRRRDRLNGGPGERDGRTEDYI